MPIRQGISDPFGSQRREFERRRREGPLPSTPARKPPAAERELLMETLKSIPLMETMSVKTFTKKWVSPFISRQFDLWGIKLAVYPESRTEYSGDKTITAILVTSITRTRRGTQPMLSLRPRFQTIWYRQILDWIEEHHYGG